MYSKILKVILDDRILFNTSSIEYEQAVHSIVVQQEDNMNQQQNYSYGTPNQEDIYQYRYDSFATGSRDVDLFPVAYSAVKLPLTIKDDLKETFSEDRDTNDLNSSNEVCSVDYDGEVNICGGKNSRKSQLYPIMDPKFNLREAAKNCILLEDHLTHEGKRCSDCIKKHCLIIEGLFEEGLTLDKKREHHQEFVKCITEFRTIFKKLADKLNNDNVTDEDCLIISQEIRKLRKPLCQKYATFF